MLVRAAEVERTAVRAEPAGAELIAAPAAPAAPETWRESTAVGGHEARARAALMLLRPAEARPGWCRAGVGPRARGGGAAR